MDFLMEISSAPADVIDDLLVKKPAVDADSLSACEQDFTIRQVVVRDFSECRSLNVKLTPTFFVRRLLADGRRAETSFSGYQRFEYFQQVFDQLLKGP
jgi:hypothetical protein